MKIISCILVISLIYRNKVLGEIVYDVLKLKPLMDNLGNIFDNNGDLLNDISCNGLTFLHCYKKLLDIYENNIQNKVIEVIEKQTIQQLEVYNELILSLFELTTESNTVIHDEDTVKSLISTISFPNSNVYCVIDFLRNFNTNLNNQLSDYIFFGDDQILQVQNLEMLKTLIGIHFKSRKKPELRLDLNITQLKDEYIPSQKQQILDFLVPFCSIELSQMKIGSWMWKKLQNSLLLSRKMYNCKSLIDWQDFKVHILLHCLQI